jgi:eukaryotic-like serine/threonine-protein kinase
MSDRVLGGRYQLHTMVGRGGMATVWAAHDVRLDRAVAVKIVDVDKSADLLGVQQLDREARIVARLAHPNIVTVYDVGTDCGVPYLVMEMVDGANLQQQLVRGPLPLQEVVRIAVQVCDALEAAHGAGLVHCDIKPGNLLLTGSGAVKLCDFGIAALQRTVSVDAAGGMVAVGTSAYMAPEQAAGAPVDARTDLYALGCVLHAMLTARPPFPGPDAGQVLWHQVHHCPTPVSALRLDIPSELDALVGQLLAKDPDDRPASAHDVRARLSDPSASAGGATPVPAIEPPIGSQASARGRASVVMPTRTLPGWNIPAEHAHRRIRGRMGPAGVAGIAFTAVAVSALIATVIAAGRTVAGTATSPSDASQTSAGTSRRPVELAEVGVDAVRRIIQAQMAAGQLDSASADDLADRLSEVDRRLANGDVDKVAAEVAKLREDLTELRADGHITATGYAAIVQSLDRLAQFLPPADQKADN